MCDKKDNYDLLIGEENIYYEMSCDLSKLAVITSYNRLVVYNLQHDNLTICEHKFRVAHKFGVDMCYNVLRFSDDNSDIVDIGIGGLDMSSGATYYKRVNLVTNVITDIEEDGYMNRYGCRSK